MGISFTEKQQRVIDARGHNLLVSAAAGSGKTAVLVERIVKMVSDGAHPVDIDRLLVVTFTNAAAAEMRERISKALNDRLAADPENEHLQRQTTLLHNARITTIDSFCLFVLRNQFHTIGLDPGFRIAEEGEGRLLRQEALEETLETCYAAEEPAFLHCMEYFSLGSRDTAVEELVLKLYDFAMSTPFPEKWLEERKQDYRIVPGQQTTGSDAENKDVPVGQTVGAAAEAAAGEEAVNRAAMQEKEAVGRTAAAQEKAVSGEEMVAFEQLPWAAQMLRQVKLQLAGCAEKLEEAVRLCEEPDGPYMYGELLEREREMTEGLLRLCGQEMSEGILNLCGQETSEGILKLRGREAAEIMSDACGQADDGGHGQMEMCGAQEHMNCPEWYDALYTAFGALCFDRLPSKKDDTVSPVKREQAKNLRAQVKEQLGDLQKKYFARTKEQVMQQMAVCGRAVEALADLTLRFKQNFDAKKRDKNILDFNDIEHFALSILVAGEADGRCVPTETALAYRSYFHEILIDEYQDSNLVQEYILSCISGEDEGRYNRFMVGDVKQSIYKFRLARPELFLEKYKAYAVQEEPETAPGRAAGGRPEGGECALEGGGAVTAEKIDLHQNFRSRKEVLNTTNTIFEQIMGQDVGGIVYDDLAALHAGAVYPAPAQASAGADDGDDGEARHGGEQDQADGTGNPYLTELLLYRTEDKPEEVSAKEQEAYGVALKIKELMRELQVTDRESGASRRLAYRDIVILLRTTSGWDEIFKRVLEQEGIPVHMTSRTGYFAAGEVQELLHFLRILDNPLQDIPLYGVLHSYLGGFDEEEIALIRAAYPEQKYLYDAVKRCAQRAGNEAKNTRTKADRTVDDRAAEELLTESGLTDKCQQFLERLKHYRELAVYLSVQELLQVILRETDYLHYVTVRPEGNKRRANVEMLLVKAADYEKTSYFGLNHFLRYMEQLEKYEVDYGEAGLLDEHADVVRIMSIHKSKGLEFPVCIVSGLAKGFQTRDLSGRLVLDIDAGIGVDYVDPVMRVRARELRRNVIAEKMKADNLAEEMRILYVAMTRAKEKLVLTGTVKDIDRIMTALLPLRQKKETLLPYDVLLGSGSFLDLLLYALARNHCMDEFYQVCGLPPAAVRNIGSRDIDAGEKSGHGVPGPSRERVCHEGAAPDGQACIRVSFFGWEDTVEEELEETVRIEEAKHRLLMSEERQDADPALMAYMADRFADRYPHENLRNLYTKTTVSELKMAGMQEEMDFSFKMYDEETVVPYLPSFLAEEERVSGSMRGSAFHKVMELFDFTELTREVNTEKRAASELFEKQFAAMRREGKLSEEYAAAVSASKIVGFLMTDTAYRMGEAARAGRLYKEQPFVLGLPADRLHRDFPHEETVLIQGIIDVFFEEDGKYVLLDYKTDAVETAEELVKRYHVQLDYYAEALEQSSGYRDTERILYSFKLGKEIYL